MKENEIILELKKYLLFHSVIDGLETYIIKSEKLCYFKKDKQLLENLFHGYNINFTFIENINKNKDTQLFFAIIHNKKVKLAPWLPVLCLKKDKQYFHVNYKENWLCRECQFDVGRVLLSLSECDRCYYIGKDIPDIPNIFRNRRCPQCGHLLQGHLIMLDY